MNRRNNTQSNSNPINKSSRTKRTPRNTRRNQRQRRNISTRRNRRFGQALNRRRNRLARAQYASRNKNFQNRRRRFAFRARTRMNLKLRKIFVGGLHKSITNSKLYNLFRREGRIVGWKVFYDRNGYSRGFGVIEYDRPRDAWKTIQKWNNTDYMGYKLRIEYKKNFRRRINRNRRMNNTNNVTKGNYINVNNRNRSFFPKSNYQNGIRNVNSTYGNRSRYYYYRN